MFSRWLKDLAALDRDSEIQRHATRSQVLDRASAAPVYRAGRAYETPQLPSFRQLLGHLPLVGRIGRAVTAIRNLGATDQENRPTAARPN